MSATTADLVVKTVYHDDVRRFKLSQASLVHLRELISKAYEKLPAYSIKYTDPEGDVCSIGSDAELEEAFNVSGTTLKLDILPTEESRASEVKSTGRNLETEKKVEVETPKKEDAKSPSGAQDEKQGKDPNALCGLCLELAQDKDIQAKLPEIMQSVLATIEKGELNIKSLLSNLFTDVPSLRENQVVQKVLPIIASQGEKINAALDRAKNYIPMILPMLKELPQMIPQFIGTLGSLDSNDLKDQLKELFTRGCPFPCEEPESDESGEEPKGGVPVHENVKCDGCGAFPITGERFKCTVCHNFDLCSTCEQKNTHPTSHPLLKIKEAPRRDIHYGVTCDGCGVVPIKGVRFKCLVCPNYDLCAVCEAKNAHPADHTLLKLKERKRGCGRFGGRPFQHFPLFGHGFGHRGRHGFGFGGHCGQRGNGDFGFGGHCGRFGGHWGQRGARHGLHGLFKGIAKILGLNKGAWGGAEKCGWAKKCHRSDVGKCHGKEGFKCRKSQSQLDAEFGQDVNYPDGSIIPSATTITKVWRMKNTGSVTWPEGSKVIFLRGNRELLGEVEEFAVPLAKPGEAVDVSCPIIVPAKAGPYSAYFRLADKERAVFGHRFWVEFDVKDDKVDTKKEVVEGKEESKKIAQGLDSTIPSIYPTLTTSPLVTLPKVSKYASALGVLEKMGFVNEKLNTSLLERAQGNVEQVVTWLLEMENSSQH